MSSSTSVELTDAESDQIWNAAKAAALKRSNKTNGPKKLNNQSSSLDRSTSLNRLISNPVSRKPSSASDIIRSSLTLFSDLIDIILSDEVDDTEEKMFHSEDEDFHIFMNLKPIEKQSCQINVLNFVVVGVSLVLKLILNAKILM